MAKQKNATENVNSRLTSTEIIAILAKVFGNNSFKDKTDSLKFDGQKNQSGVPIVYVSYWNNGAKVMRCSINNTDKLQMIKGALSDQKDIKVIQTLITSAGSTKTADSNIEYV